MYCRRSAWRRLENAAVSDLEVWSQRLAAHAEISGAHEVRIMPIPCVGGLIVESPRDSSTPDRSPNPPFHDLFGSSRGAWLSFAKTRSSVSEAQGCLDATADHGLVKLEQAMPATASGCRRDPGTNGPAFGERDRALFRS